MLLWSRGKAYSIKPLIPASLTASIKEIIESEDNLGGMTYQQLEDKVPYISASFTDWRY
jgi:hypothetical protein